MTDVHNGTTEKTVPIKKAGGRVSLRLQVIRLHRWVAFVGGITLLIWGASGLMHVAMSAFGPQPVRFFPPERPLQLAEAEPLDAILGQAGVRHAAAVKVIVGENENLLQITETQDTPRRYFRLSDGTELNDHDPHHAVHLARYFMDEAEAPIRSVEWVTAFSDSYPAVNRLLPVYKVVFDRSDKLAVYIYTETNTVAAVTNARKEVLQQAFQWMHTWSWMPHEAGWLRTILMGTMIIGLIAMALSGLAMIALIRRRSRAPGPLGWHRLSGYLLWLPILALSGSGLFHLLQHHGSHVSERILTLSPPLGVAGVSYPINQQWEDMTRGMTVNSLSLVQAADGQWLYRLSMAPDQRNGPRGSEAIRNARFDGKPNSGAVHYVDASTGRIWEEGDRELALQLGERFTGVDRSAVKELTMVTRFGSGYDFRNKRLPVWRLDYGAPVNASVYIDTAAGVLADQTLNSARAELFSFSYFHKWAFLSPLGRSVQNLVIALVVAGSLILMGVIGLQLDLKRRGRKRAFKRQSSLSGVE
jgi:hypothetical protein